MNLALANGSTETVLIFINRNILSFLRTLTKKWLCSRVYCKPFNLDPIDILTTSVNKLMENIDSWSANIDKISHVSAGIAEIKTDIGQIND